MCVFECLCHACVCVSVIVWVYVCDIESMWMCLRLCVCVCVWKTERSMIVCMMQQFPFRLVIQLFQLDSTQSWPKEGNIWNEVYIQSNILKEIKDFSINKYVCVINEIIITGLVNWNVSNNLGHKTHVIWIYRWTSERNINKFDTLFLQFQ